EVERVWLEGLEFSVTSFDEDGRVTAELVNVSSPYQVISLREFWVVDQDYKTVPYKDEEKFNDTIGVVLAVGESDSFTFTPDELDEELVNKADYAISARIRVITKETQAVEDSMLAGFTFAPKLEAIPIELATNMANSYVQALNQGVDFITPGSNAWNEWLGVENVTYSVAPDSLKTYDDAKTYEFKVNALSGDAIYQATITLHLIDEAPFYAIPKYKSDFSEYYPLVFFSSADYAEGLKNGDLEALADVLNPDGLQRDVALAQAQTHLDYYKERFDLSNVTVTDVMYDDVLKNFTVTMLDAQDKGFVVTYAYGDGLAAPVLPEE
ncbi:MAG: hypothetical protein LBC41_04760, partial [Clostridiales bacterium]|nr:hypothetical protein [Clostridiales bacterium]